MRALYLLAAGLLLVGPAATADDTSASDKLRILYSSRFTFTPDGLPLVTVEIMNGQRELTLSAPGGLRVRPDGESGSSIEAAGAGLRWTVRAENTKPAQIEEWTVVETLGGDDPTGVADALARWTERGFAPRAFEVGTVFGVGGEVIDTREVRIGVDPVAAGAGEARAAARARRFGVPATVHAELVRRPSGTIVAQSGATVVRNPSVVWLQAMDAKDPITVHDVVVGGGGSQLTTSREDRRYWGSVYVTLDRTGQLVAVNAVAEDKLLAGLVPAEIFPDAPDAALDAQAIAARTELIGKLGKRSLVDPFMLCSTQACQVYAGAGHEHPRTTAAVRRTRGQVMLRDGGGLVDARYSASCGGHGEHNDHIWGGEPDPSLRGRADGPKARTTPIDEAHLDKFLAESPKDSWCGKASMGGKGRFRWTENLTSAQVDERIAAAYPEIGHVTAMVAKTRGVSGRIGTLALRGTQGQVEVTGDLKIRRLLGGLKSTLFKIEPQGPAKDPTGFVLRGAGFGHGVGMCQTGAIGMAEAGKDRAAILGHYYRGSRVQTIY